MKYILAYLLIVNLITFITFGIDKRKAIKNKWRIRESVLLTLGALGGCIGGLIAMQCFRHKTQKPVFKFGMPIILVLQLALAGYCIYKGIIF